MTVFLLASLLMFGAFLILQNKFMWIRFEQHSRCSTDQVEWASSCACLEIGFQTQSKKKKIKLWRVIGQMCVKLVWEWRKTNQARDEESKSFTQVCQRHRHAMLNDNTFHIQWTASQHEDIHRLCETDKEARSWKTIAVTHWDPTKVTIVNILILEVVTRLSWVTATRKGTIFLKKTPRSVCVTGLTLSCGQISDNVTTNPC